MTTQLPSVPVESSPWDQALYAFLVEKGNRSAISLLPAALDASGDYTLSVRIESSDVSLLYINDTVTAAIDESGPIGGVLVEVVAVGS